MSKAGRLDPGDSGASHAARRFSLVFLLVAGLFVALWATAVGVESGVLADLDVRCAGFLNSHLRDSETLDLTAVVLSRRPGDVFIAITAVLLSLRYISRSRDRGLAGLLVVAVSFGAIVAGTDFVVDAVDSFARRPSPLHRIEGFVVPGGSIGVEFHAPDRTRFPSDRAANIAVLFFLCLFRYGSKSLPLLALSVLAGAAHVATGRAWPSDVVGGIVLGWLIASAVYLVRLNEAMAWAIRLVDARGVSRAEAWLRRHMSPRSEAPRSGEARASASVRRLEEVLRRGWDCESVLFTGVRHKDKVFSFEVDGRRMAFKRSRERTQDRADLERALRRVEGLRNVSGFPSPRVIPTKTGGLLATEGGRHFHLLEWVEGEPPDFADPGAFRDVMGVLALLHRDTAEELERDRAIAAVDGRIEGMRQAVRGLSRSARPVLWALVPRNAEHSTMRPVAAEALRAILLSGRALSELSRTGARPVRCMVHGDPHPMNYVVAPGGELLLVDLDSIRPGFPHEDLVKPLAKLMRRHDWDAGQFIAALDAYCQVRPMLQWEILLLVAEVLFPRALRRGRMPSYRLRREDFELAFSRRARERFVREVAARWTLPIDARSDSEERELSRLLGIE